MPESRIFECLDCGIDTCAICEYYMVTDEIWNRAVPNGKGFLCIACLEGRIGRELTPEDFPEVACNDPMINKHSKLLSGRMDG